MRRAQPLVICTVLSQKVCSKWCRITEELSSSYWPGFIQHPWKGDPHADHLTAGTAARLEVRHSRVDACVRARTCWCVCVFRLIDRQVYNRDLVHVLRCSNVRGVWRIRPQPMRGGEHLFERTRNRSVFGRSVPPHSRDLSRATCFSDNPRLAMKISSFGNE